MKFNLTRMKEELNKSVLNGKISPNTANIYTTCIQKLNDYLPDNATSNEVADAIMIVGGKSAESYKTAISFYERKVMSQSGSILSAKDRTKIHVNQKVKELYHKPRFYRDRIRNSKYRLELTLQERSGLRVSELAAITRADIMIKDGQILLNVRSGKGGKQRIVHVLPSNYLLEELPKFQEMPKEKALKDEARRLGFSSHDLRRVNARTRYWLARAEGMKKREAVKSIMPELGHDKSEITLRYIGNEYDKRKDDWGYLG